MLELHGWGDLQDELNGLSKQGKWEEMGELIADEILHTFAVVAEPEKLAAGLDERYGDVVDRLSFYAPYKSDPERWRAVMEQLKAGLTPRGPAPREVLGGRIPVLTPTTDQVAGSWAAARRAGRRATPLGAPRRGSGSCRASAGACPSWSWAGVPGATSTISLAGRPTASRTRSATERRTSAWSSPLLSATTTSAFLALVAVDAEGDDVAGAHAVDVGDGPLDVLGEHVAAADDDHVLDAAAHDQLAVEQVGEVAGAEPAVVEQLGGGVGSLVVAGRHRRAADLELADLAVLEHRRR